ncbi:hypothetical protein A2311_03495 [candidate division WOR-1 bacterium RIFOXYB2_FULL_48_7]|uniref:Undecaprenyl-diphosphatase n=1 Tax=candidate division WOR-1 bacterium RIFOXYB2_FULL_48_7 TaxID=1802583 RepID=A0A1F4TSM0_UNCSA|nr:MAG: hypothetical protein A2311_03495 [candidate division WOR-1 bacterium RIFOXYB2_FULL_48_7]
MEYFVLGIVQGLTEFLPVSSQGHLLIFERLFNLQVNIAFDTVVHLGTALAAIVYFWRDIWELLTVKHRLLGLVMVSTAITGVLGVAFKDYFEALFANFFFVGPFFVLTGLLIMAGEKLGKGNRGEAKFNFIDAAIIGLAQGAAIVPSLSRSGTTIAAALACNLERDLAARFSFLISIPAILGAGLLQSKAIIKTGTIGLGAWPLILGFTASFISGLLAIRIFMELVRRASLRWFAYYCLALGIVLLLWQIR